MTDFVQFVTTKYKDYIRIDRDGVYFYCGIVPIGICSTCPNDHLNMQGCNYFTDNEVKYIQTKLPEALI